jgi:hypothetical protein
MNAFNYELINETEKYLHFNYNENTIYLLITITKTNQNSLMIEVLVKMRHNF